MSKNLSNFNYTGHKPIVQGKPIKAPAPLTPEHRGLLLKLSMGTITLAERDRCMEIDRALQASWRA